ncbi:hypothetical protein ACFU6I_25685 [Streptomyces sp. NPDC057486]|uniref:hypothetical protein n=1 Tax=Streptomyces sp. NPDC057486 TaxID=3346145 RepID=UPI0036A2EBA4
MGQTAHLPDDLARGVRGDSGTDPAPPSPATCALLSPCLDLVTDPLLEEVQDRNPAALARLWEVHQALRAQREDRHRAGALLSLGLPLLGRIAQQSQHCLRREKASADGNSVTSPAGSTAHEARRVGPDGSGPALNAVVLCS